MTAAEEEDGHVKNLYMLTCWMMVCLVRARKIIATIHI